MKAGIILVIVGVAFFLKSTGLLPNLNWDMVWPILIIVIGVFMIMKKGCCKGCWHSWAKHCKDGKCEDCEK